MRTHPGPLQEISRPNPAPKRHMQMISSRQIKILYEKYLELIRLETTKFGVRPTEVRHLIGRLGEFYCALQVKGTLASTPNQPGFDVISKEGRRISVKTTAQKSGFIPISSTTIDKVDELMIIQYWDENLSVIYHGDIKAAVKAARHYKEVGRYNLDISKARQLA